MAQQSSIEWCDATWNPVTGCTKVSPGCDRCYAETFAERWRGTPGHHFEVGFDLTLRPGALTTPLRWRKPRRIFVNSMSDLFHQDVPDEYIARVWAVMALTPHHTYQVLTKRHGRMRSLLRSGHFRQLCESAEADLVGDEATPMPGYKRRAYLRQWWSHFATPLPNVWLGVSVEDQQRADLRIPALLETPAAVRFLSCEPLLGPVEITDHVSQPCPCCMGEGHDPACGDCDVNRCEDGHIRMLHWVIAGGESGTGARLMHPAWARELRDQCVQEHIPFFFKQLGTVAARELGVPGKGTDLELIPADLRIRESA
ncbi:phage Gp37/Gp68 family protein [Streptomyces sp. WMMB303]|uniref:DUF5131 family protein n=1 Tax=Streptomyces sp. WMMB303 TaxID=3034154 RepID=UPI0023ECE43A|nr:phage Gp37/Gp68 family protein [Streptomyces sp. WMMB303]MDF4254634.1 phage Gp37/Gp68 family protein [Streptomyces sp. WMMB303]